MIWDSFYWVVVNVQDRLFVVYHTEDQVVTQRVIVLVLWEVTALIPTDCGFLHLCHCWTSYEVQQTLSKDKVPLPRTEGKVSRYCGPGSCVWRFVVSYEMMLLSGFKETFYFFLLFIFFYSVFWKQCVIIMTSWLLISPLLPEVKTSSLSLCTVHMHTQVCFIVRKKKQFHTFLVHRNGDNDETIV